MCKRMFFLIFAKIKNYRIKISFILPPFETENAFVLFCLFVLFLFFCFLYFFFLLEYMVVLVCEYKV